MRWIVMVVLVGLVASARAEDRSKARALYRQGGQHYDVGDYKLALDSFKEAYRQFESPEILFNIAQCHRQLGDDQQAVRGYRMYLVKSPDAANRVEVEGLIAKLEKQIAAAQANRALPPQETLPTPQQAVPETAPVPTTTVAATPKPEMKSTPIYKRWWLWTIVGAVVVVGVGVGVGLALQDGTPGAKTDLGTVRF